MIRQSDQTTAVLAIFDECKAHLDDVRREIAQALYGDPDRYVSLGQDLGVWTSDLAKAIGARDAAERCVRACMELDMYAEAAESDD